jgi:uncharacterized protein YdeI (BOF family)
MLARFFPIALALAIAIGAMAELAFTSSKIYTVKGAIRDADTAIVTIVGRVKPLGNNRFILRDSTGSCELQTCPLWYRPITLAPNEKVTVTGQVIKNITPISGAMYPISVQSIKRETGAEIVVREGFGRPPWVSARH